MRIDTLSAGSFFGLFSDVYKIQDSELSVGSNISVAIYTILGSIACFRG